MNGYLRAFIVIVMLFAYNGIISCELGDGNSTCVVCDSYSAFDSCDNWDGFSYIKDCTLESGIDITKPITCRKMVFEIINKRRVVRQCSNLAENPDYPCIDRVGTHKIKVRYCLCSGPFCNTAVQVSYTPASLLGFLVAALIKCLL